MLKLDPLIAGFVHDVLRALRGATLDELSDLFSLPATPSRAPRAVAARPVAREVAREVARPVKPTLARPTTREPARPVAREIERPLSVVPAAPRPKGTPVREPRTARAAAPKQVVRALKATVKSLAHSIVADITDPEWLLSATTHVAPAEAPREAAAAEDDVPPASGERLARVVTTALRAGETLVRSSGSGVVIRRAKRV